MNSLKSLNPRTQLPQYPPNPEVNFEMIHEGEALKANSVFLTGKLVAVINGGALASQKFYDNYVGVASFLENVNVRCDLYQEVITNYARHAKMNAVGTLSPDQLCSGLKNTSEMLLPHLEHTRLIIHDAQAGAKPFGFAHKLLNSLNNMTGDLDYAKSGRIQLSFKVPSVQKAFFGADSNTITTYYMTDLELHYMTVPAGSPSVAIRVVEDTQKLISTSNTTVMNTFINPIDNVLVSFATTDSETDATQNSLVAQMPNIAKLSWVYNDQSNRLVAYEIETKEEQILSGYSVLKSLGAAIDLRDKIVMATQDTKHSRNDGFLVGLALGQLLDFSRTGLGLNVKIDNLTQQYYAYFYGYGTKVLF